MRERVDTIATERLLMRRWRDADREPYAALNADPRIEPGSPIRPHVAYRLPRPRAGDGRGGVAAPAT